MSDSRSIVVPGLNLADRYRPKTFDEVIGQRHAVRLLGNLPPDQRPPHLLLTGPSGTGKTTIARNYSKMLLCSAAAVRPCGTCSSCIIFDAREVHPAYHELNAADEAGTKEALQEFDEEYLQSKPIGFRLQIFFLDEMHAASIPARDLLLKWLEEKKHVIFIFALIDVDRLPEQFQTRALAISLQPPTVKDIEEWVDRLFRIEQVDCVPDARLLIASHASNFRRAAIWTEHLILARPGGIIDADLVRTTLLKSRSSAVVAFLGAAVTADLEALDAAIEQMPSDPGDKFDAVQQLLWHLKRNLIGPNLRAGAVSDLLYDPAECRTLVSLLQERAARLGKPLADLFGEVVDDWSHRPLIFTDALFRLQADKFVDRISVPQQHSDAPAIWLPPADLPHEVSARRPRAERRRRLILPAPDRAYLSLEQAAELYEASTFMLQRWGCAFNARLDVRATAPSMTVADLATITTSVSRELAQQFARWGEAEGLSRRLHRVSLLHRSRDGTLGAKLIFHLPAGRHDSAEEWLASFFRRLEIKAAHFRPRVEFSHAVPEQRKRVFERHWQLVRGLWGSLHPGARLGGMPALDRLDVPNAWRTPAGMIDGRRVHYSQSIGRKARLQAAADGLAHLSAWRSCRWDELFHGWEYDEHKERQVEIDRRQRRLIVLRNAHEATLNDLSRTRIEHQFAQERASWHVAAEERPRNRSVWDLKSPIKT